MDLFNRKKNQSSDWKKKALAFKASVVRFLQERNTTRLTPDMYILERKIVFLLDDLRLTIENNEAERTNGITEQIGDLWLKLWDLRRGAKKS